MNNNNPYFKKLLTSPIQKLLKEVIDSVRYLSPIKNEFYKRNVKYTIEDYAIGIIDVTKNNISWNSYHGKINGNTLRKKHNEWVKLGVYKHVYEKSIHKYLKKSQRTNELKYQSIDSTFIEDKNGSKYATYNKLYKRRKGEPSKGIKITSIVTTNGIPISVSIDQAHKHDSPLLPKAINSCVINCNTKKYTNHNRYKQYLIADSGYDSKNNHAFLKNKGYTPLIKQNIRNITNKKLIRNMNEKHKEIYKKRIVIENYHAWLKKFPKIKLLCERKIENYVGLLFLGISIIIYRRILNKR